ncbi:MAG: hypothetical protein ABIQ33_14535 [Caldimonas sp.]
MKTTPSPPGSMPVAFCSLRASPRAGRGSERKQRTAHGRPARANWPRDPLLHFCDGHAFSFRRQVARPGSLALASLPDVRATLIALAAPEHRAPRVFVRRCRPRPPSGPDLRRLGGA